MKSYSDLNPSKADERRNVMPTQSKSKQVEIEKLRHFFSLYYIERGVCLYWILFFRFITQCSCSFRFTSILLGCVARSFVTMRTIFTKSARNQRKKGIMSMRNLKRLETEKIKY